MRWLLVLLVPGAIGACGELKIADEPDAGAALLDATAPGNDRPDGTAPDVAVVPPPSTVKLAIAPSTVSAGSISIAADATGDVVMAWLDTPSAERHLHVARIAGGENPPRLVVSSDTPLEATGSPVGQAVSTFTPFKGCFGLVWGQAGSLRVASVAVDAKPSADSPVAPFSNIPVTRLSQVRTATDAAGQTLVAWSEVARFGGDAPGVFHSGALGFSSACVPGPVTLDADALSLGPLPFVAPPAGAAELAVSRAAGTFRAATHYSVSGTIYGVTQRPRAGAGWGTALAVDDGGVVSAGGSVGIAPNDGALAVAYYRRKSDTVGELVVAALAPNGDRTGETVLETSVLIGTAATTSLEAARVAVVGLEGGRAAVVAAFARDANTSELRVYRADPAAPGGFRSELVESGVFGPRGGADGHPLLDAAVDGSGRIHVAWRSGVSKAIGYVRLPP